MTIRWFLMYSEGAFHSEMKRILIIYCCSLFTPLLQKIACHIQIVPSPLPAEAIYLPSGDYTTEPSGCMPADECKIETVIVGFFPCHSWFTSSFRTCGEADVLTQFLHSHLQILHPLSALCLSCMMEHISHCVISKCCFTSTILSQIYVARFCGNA